MDSSHQEARPEQYQPSGTGGNSRIDETRFYYYQPSGSTGITRLGSPFRLNITYLDEDEEELIPQPLEEELTQEVINTLFGGGVGRSRMQNMGEILYTNNMLHRGLTFEEVD